MVVATRGFHRTHPSSIFSRGRLFKTHPDHKAEHYVPYPATHLFHLSSTPQYNIGGALSNIQILCSSTPSYSMLNCDVFPNLPHVILPTLANVRVAYHVIPTVFESDHEH